MVSGNIGYNSLIPTEDKRDGGAIREYEICAKSYG